MSKSFKRNSRAMRTFTMPPRYLAILTVTLLTALFGTALFELQNQKHEIQHIMHEEASVLLQALSLGAENAILSYNEIKNSVAERLLDNIRLIDRLDAQRPLTSADLAAIAAQNALFRVNIFDAEGRKLAFSHAPEHTGLQPKFSPADFLRPILEGAVDSLVIGFKPSRFLDETRFAVAVRRSRGGAIVANVDAAELLQLRRKLGVGRLIQTLGRNIKGIRYIVWQDTSAILSATENVTEMEAIQDDPFLLQALTQDSVVSRLTTFNGGKIFEVVRPFTFQGEAVGLLRIGLVTDHIDAALARLRRRFIMLTALLFVGGLVLFNLFIARQNEAMLAKAYQREQAFSSKVLKNMGDAVVALDSRGNVTLLNRTAEKLFGLSSQNVTGKAASQVLTPCAGYFSEIFSGKKPRAHREVQCEIGGRHRVLEANFSAMPSEQGRPDGYVVVLRDLTEQRALQKIVQRQEKLTAMGKLASGVAHEIRNPLNAIGMLSQRLDLEFTPKESEGEYRQLVRTVYSEVQRLNQIIQRFLKFARPPKLNLAEVSLNDYLARQQSLFRGETESRQVHFSLHSDCDLTVPLDAGQMQQVLLNLVRNAAQASSPGDEVRLKCFLQDQFCAIEVQDFGSGIAPENLNRIFDLYFTTKEDGTGMGLSIANQIVQAHGGFIQVESEPGKGSRFQVFLPVG